MAQHTCCSRKEQLISSRLSSFTLIHTFTVDEQHPKENMLLLQLHLNLLDACAHSVQQTDRLTGHTMIGRSRAHPLAMSAGMERERERGEREQA